MEIIVWWHSLDEEAVVSNDYSIISFDYSTKIQQEIPIDMREAHEAATKTINSITNQNNTVTKK